eukprot:4616505-Alexandrium_andersonii.AAC.1
MTVASMAITTTNAITTVSCSSSGSSSSSSSMFTFATISCNVNFNSNGRVPSLNCAGPGMASRAAPEAPEGRPLR